MQVPLGKTAPPCRILPRVIESSNQEVNGKAGENIPTEVAQEVSHANLMEVHDRDTGALDVTPHEGEQQVPPGSKCLEFLRLKGTWGLRASGNTSALVRGRTTR